MTEPGISERDPKQIVLIVEDERFLGEVISETLGREGLQTVTCFDGEQALALARLLQPDLILLDVMLPDISGFKVCEILKAQLLTATIPVGFITAKTQQADLERGIAAGASAYITKPFSPIELIELVEEVLAGQPVKRQRPVLDLSAEPADQLLIYARELKKLYEQERDRCQALERVQKRLNDLHRSKAAFLDTMTHELMTPFAKLGLALQVVQRQSDAFHPDQQEALENLATEIAQLHRLINGVVKFAGLVNKQREPQPGHVSLDQVIPGAVQPVAVLAQAREVDFRVFVPDYLPKIHADPELLGEAVFQMAHNAVKFNAPGGEAQLRVLASEDRVIIEVVDNGVGLTPERLAVLGQPFEQSADALRRGQEGLGIGWAFVCYVAKVHGGWTNVESPGPGQGSAFSLTLPMVATEQAHAPVLRGRSRYAGDETLVQE